MANINALIAQGVEPIQLEDPMNQMAKVYKVKALQQEMAARDQAMAEQNALRDFLRSNPDISSQEALNRLTTGFGKTGLEYGTKLQDLAAKRFEAQTKQWKMVEDKTNYFRDSLASVNTPEDARAWTAAIYSDPDVGPVAQRLGGSLEQAVAKVPNDPQGFMTWKQQAALGAPEFIKQAKLQLSTQDTNGALISKTFNPLTGELKTIGTERKTLAPGEAERIAIARRNAAVAEQRLTAEQATGEYSPETINFLAETYIQTGTLPPLGIGKKAAAIKMNVLDRARQLATGAGAAATPGEVAVPKATTSEAVSNIAQAKQTRAAEQATVRSFATGVEGRSVRSFNTAINHLDTMDKLATALQNNDVRSFNAIGNMFAKETGKPAPTDFDAAKAIVGGEVAKALTGANMALKDREEIRDSLARANSPAQLKGVVKTLQELMGGQLESLQLQYESGTGRKDFDKKMTGRAKEVVSSLQGQTPAKPAAQAAAMYARNPKTGERIMSLDGGNTWSPAR